MTRVRVELREELGVARQGELVRCGVPLPVGTARDVTALLVRDERGDAVPCQVLWSEHDPAGWLQWVGLALPVTLDPLGQVRFTVEAGNPATRLPDGVSAVTLTVADGVVQFGTGDAITTVTLDPVSIESPGAGVRAVDLRVTDPDGKVYPAVVAGSGVVVLQGGPLLAQVGLRGRYRTGTSSHWGFEARLTAEAGSAALTVDVRIINDADESESTLSGWAVNVHTPPVTGGGCGVPPAGHRTSEPFTVRHRGLGHPHGSFATSEVLGGGDDWTDASEPGYSDQWEWAELHGRQATNWVTAEHATDLGGTTLAVHRFAENHPGDLAVEGGGIRIRFWPEDAGPLTLTQGAAKTRSFRVLPGHRPHAGLELDGPVVAHPVDAVESGRLTKILPYLPETYPGLESHIREELFGWYLNGQSLGFHDFGDSVQGITTGPRTGYSANNEHDALLALTQHFVRSGERAYFDSAQAYADHLCDIDLIHHSTVFPAEVGGLRAHGRAHVHYVDARTPDGPVRSSIDTGHMWTEGLVLFGLVSGERRYLDAARRVADCLVELTELGWTRPEPGPRNSGWPLMALASVYGATRDPRYLEAMRATAKAAIATQSADGRWTMRLGLTQDYCAWQNAVLLTGLARLLEIEESAAVRAAFLKGSRALVDLGRNRDGTFIYLTRFDYRWANRPALVREALALAYGATGETRYLEAGLQGGRLWYRAHGAAPALSNDVAEWRGHLPFLARAHEAGLLTDLVVQP